MLIKLVVDVVNYYCDFGGEVFIDMIDIYI